MHPFLRGLALGVGLAVSVSGCGYKTAPRPHNRFLPPAVKLKAFQRENRVVVAWRLPPVEPGHNNGGLQGFRLLVERIPFGCEDCRPASAENISLRLGQPELAKEGEGYIYQYLPHDPQNYWRFRVSPLYGAGEGRQIASGLVRGLNDIPAHALRGKLAPGARGGGLVSLSWDPRREQIVRLQEGGSSSIETERYYRFNLYRRRVGEPWPLTPLNDTPLDVYLWTDNLPPAGEGKIKLEYTLRLVDRQGGEGPAALPLALGPY